jgi:hypothetical protein
MEFQERGPSAKAADSPERFRPRDSGRSQCPIGAWVLGQAPGSTGCRVQVPTLAWEHRERCAHALRVSVNDKLRVAAFALLHERAPAHCGKFSRDYAYNHWLKHQGNTIVVVILKIFHEVVTALQLTKIITYVLQTEAKTCPTITSKLPVIS